jgi:hypothetical protein
MSQPLTNVDYLSNYCRSKILAIKVFEYPADLMGKEKAIKDVALDEGIILTEPELELLKNLIFVKEKQNA